MRIPRSAIVVVLALCFAAAAAALDGGSRSIHATGLVTATAAANAPDTPAVETTASSDAALVVEAMPSGEATPAVEAMQTGEATPADTLTSVPPTATAMPPAVQSPTPTQAPTRVPTRTPTSAPRPATAMRASPVVAQIAPVAAGATVSINADEQKVFSLVNQARAAAGLSSLTIDPTFESVARARAVGMARTAYYSHYDPATGQLAARSMLQSLGVDVPMGENFYVNWPYDGEFAQRAMQWFMNSPPHRGNILTPRWTVAGIGLITTSDQRGVAIEVFGMK